MGNKTYNFIRSKLGNSLFKICWRMFYCWAVFIFLSTVFTTYSTAWASVTPKIAGGFTHSVALKSDGTVWAWGYNNYGALGDGSNTDRNTPVQVINISNVTAVACGAYHSLALKSDGTVWAWGYNHYGELGDGSGSHKNSPVQTSDLTGVSAIDGGDSHGIALKSDGTVWVWGDNLYRQLGKDGYFQSHVPIQVSTLSGITSIAGGSQHNLCIKSDGTVWTWGRNDFGQLGDGSTSTYKSAPAQVSNIYNVTAITGGYFHSIALKSDGTVWAWGRNDYGQLGDGGTIGYSEYKAAPVQVSNLTGIIAISCRRDHNLALKSDGTVWAWGANGSGQLGDGTTTNRNTPIQVNGLNSISTIACGGSWSLAMKSDGTVWAWGGNYYGYLGDGTTTSRNTPVQINLNLTQITTPTPTPTPSQPPSVTTGSV